MTAANYGGRPCADDYDAWQAWAIDTLTKHRWDFNRQNIIEWFLSTHSAHTHLVPEIQDLFF
jgi:hypothetical protein